MPVMSARDNGAAGCHGFGEALPAGACRQPLEPTLPVLPDAGRPKRRHHLKPINTRQMPVSSASILMESNGHISTTTPAIMLGHSKVGERKCGPGCEQQDRRALGELRKANTPNQRTVHR